MTLDQLMDYLWKDYSAMNKQAEAIHKALEARGEKIVNDHVAFRTFDIPKVGIEAMAAFFLKLGYKPHSQDYSFPEKKLIARHYEHPDPNQPKIFISALKYKEFSKNLQKLVEEWVEKVPESLVKGEKFLISGTPWPAISWKIYQELLKESEYAAWMAAFGFRVNHFTIFFNHLKTFKDFSDLNQFIKSIGYPLNAAGGETKGSPQVYLEQSSTLAYPVEVQFADRKEVIPACYYEFARRYSMPNGKLFHGFLPESANQIFHSTDYRK